MVWYTFKAKPFKTSGGSIAITVPKFFVKQDYIKPSSEYVFAVRVDLAVKVPSELDVNPHVPQPTVTKIVDNKTVSLATPLQSGSSDDSGDVVEETYTTDDEYETE